MKDIDVPETKTDDSDETNKADPIEASSETTTVGDSDDSGVGVSATPPPGGPKDKNC
jgi:hypothetical protein